MWNSYVLCPPCIHGGLNVRNRFQCQKTYRGIYFITVKRFVFKLALYILSGVIVNVAVAWACVLLINMPKQNSSATILSVPTGKWYVSLRNTFGTTYIISSRDKITWSESTPAQSAEQVIPSWAYILMTPTEQYNNGGPAILEVREVAGRGWPIRTLWNEVSRSVGPRTGFPYEQSLDGIPIPRWLRPLDTIIIIFPIHPIWRGFVINTIFYGALLWLLTLGPLSARRMIRHQCGRCIKCGYDLRGNSEGGCPECGWGRVEVKA